MRSPSCFQIIFLWLTACATAWGQVAAPAHLKLDWVLQQVRENNSEVRAAQSEAEMADAQITSSRSWPDPQVGVEFWDFPRPGLDLNAAGSKWLDISQEIPFPAKTILQSGVAYHAAELKKVQANKVLQEQLFMAKQAYWDFYTASQSLEVVSRTSRTLGDLVGLSEKRIQLGQGGRMEQLMDPMARMEKVGLENQLLALAQERDQAAARLEQLMGTDVPDGAEPEEGSLPDFSGISQNSVEERALDSRPSVLEARHHLFHLRAQEKLTASAWLPDVMLQYSLIDNSGGPQTSMAMAKVNLPFIWFWRQGAEVHAADKEVEASEAMTRAAMLETSAMVENEWEMLRTARKQLENDQAEALPSADKALRLGLSGYRSGSIGVADALSAVKSYLMTNLEAIGLTAQIRRSVAGLEALVGGKLDGKVELEINHENH